MKHYFKRFKSMVWGVALSAALAIGAVSCVEPYNDTDIWEEIDQIKGDIEFKNVTFKYTEETGDDAMFCAEKMSGNDGMEIFVQGNEDRILLLARYDNLGKGASGAAIENMNIAIGACPVKGLVL